MDKAKAAEKVLHLLKLASDNSNENESKAAGEMAMRIVEKYKLTREDLGLAQAEHRQKSAPRPRQQQHVVRVVVVQQPMGWTTASTGSATTSTASYSYYPGGWSDWRRP